MRREGVGTGEENGKIKTMTEDCTTVRLKKKVQMEKHGWKIMKKSALVCTAYATLITP